eukprot:1159466-Pelagomonas_calceolata.AAC.5
MLSASMRLRKHSMHESMETSDGKTCLRRAHQTKAALLRCQAAHMLVYGGEHELTCKQQLGNR